MKQERAPFYLSTPIYYATAKPHLGSLYSTILADVVSRWQRLQGRPTWFLTGTDEHGQKIAQAASAAGMSPQDFVDSHIPAYHDAWRQYHIEYDVFARTTSKEHIAGAQALVKKLMETGDIYKGSYQGWYCTPCETFVTEKHAAGTQAPACPSCSRATHEVAEESYFFRLSAYKERLLAWYKQHPDFIVPHQRAQEVISFVEQELKDLSVSRTTISWGVPFPGDERHRIYVWVEALCIYITGVGYGDAAAHESFERWWPAHLHIIGKDIVRFHAVFWPALLMAAGLPLPKQLLVHGWIKVGDQKMSKSLGNVIDPLVLLEKYGADEVRYYLARQMAISQDGAFSVADLEQRLTSDLAHDLGNLLNRLVGLAEKHDGMRLAAPAQWDEKAAMVRAHLQQMVQQVEQQMAQYQFHAALATIWSAINQINAYFHAAEPWKMAKTDRAGFEQVLSATAHALRAVATMLWPVMPEKMEQLLESLGESLKLGSNQVAAMRDEAWEHAFVLTKIPALFKKYESEQPAGESMASELRTETALPAVPTITIDDFVKMELRVGTITDAEGVEKSDKLLKLQVDFGALGIRQILSGIKKHISPEQLMGTQALFVTNLAPRAMMGLESHGMLLTAEDEQGKLQVMRPGAPVAAGTKLK